MNIERRPAQIPLFTELRGERVLVRPYRREDARAVFDAIVESREHILCWMAFPDEHQTIEDTQNWLVHSMSSWLLREDLALAVCERKSGRFLGGSNIQPRSWSVRYFEIGYWLRVSATGRGYMTEAASLIVNYLFTKQAANRVELRCDANNFPSAAIARRLGFTLEGCLRNEQFTPAGTLRDTMIFGMTPADRARQKE